MACYMLDFQRDIGVSIYKTRVKFYKARLSYEENITMQKRRLNQEE